MSPPLPPTAAILLIDAGLGATDRHRLCSYFDSTRLQCNDDATTSRRSYHRWAGKKPTTRLGTGSSQPVAFIRGIASPPTTAGIAGSPPSGPPTPPSTIDDLRVGVTCRYSIEWRRTSQSAVWSVSFSHRHTDRIAKKTPLAADPVRSAADVFCPGAAGC